jgi:hypothetical protein
MLPLTLLAMPALSFDKASVAQSGALSGVTSVYVAPAALALPEPSSRFDRRGDQPRAVTDSDAQAKAEELTAALRRGFDKNFSLADAPGPGVLVVEPTLLRLESSRPTMADYQRESGLSFESVYAGGAAVRVTLSRDGSEVGQIEDRYTGNFSDGSPRIGIWQDTDRAFSMWSRQVPAWVEQPLAASR